jgi:hypothetical protein
MHKKPRAILALENGLTFSGYGFGHLDCEAEGEVVFNTALTGYQEIMSDPSYKGQIMTFTYPHIGNYGINPYDYDDQKELRNYFRTDSVSYNKYTSRDQGSWDFCAGSCLPMATLFFGGIEYFFPTSQAYRYIFAFFDSLLAVLVLAIIINKWKLGSSTSRNNEIHSKFQNYLPLIIGLCLGAISPVFLLNGTINSQYKGIGLLLILSAIYFSDKSLKKYSILLSPLLLGFSISFIGLGIFIVPICFYNIYNNYSFKYLIL